MVSYLYKHIFFIVLLIIILSSCSATQDTNKNDKKATVNTNQTKTESYEHNISKNNVNDEIEEPINTIDNIDNNQENEDNQDIEETVIDLGNERFVTLKNIKSNIIEINFEGINIDDYILFGNPDDDYKLYLLKKDNSEIKKIFNDGSFNGVADLSPEMHIYIYNNNRLIEIHNYNPISGKLLEDVDIYRFLVHNDKVYFVRDNNIYSIDNEFNEELLHHFDKGYITNFKAYGNSLYFINRGYLYRFNLESKRINQITGYGSNIDDYAFYKDIILYIDSKYYSSEIMLYNVKNHKKSSFFKEDSDLDGIKIFDDNIYIWSKTYIKKLNWDKQVLGETDFLAFPTAYHNELYFNKDKIFYRNYNQTYGIDYNLNQIQLVWGLGNTKQSSISIMDDKAVYICPETSMIFIEDDENELGALLSSDHTSNIFNYKNTIYYINSIDNNLYSVNNKEKSSIIQKNIRDFYIFGGFIYYIDMDDNYGLFMKPLEDDDFSKLLPGPVANLYADNEFIYYSDLADNSSLYRLSKKNSSKEKITDFPTGKALTLGEHLYYFNKLDPNTLYIRKDNGNETKKIDGVVNIHRYEDNIFYLKNYGTGILYQLENENLDEKFIAFMDEIYCGAMDFNIYENKIYNFYGCEGGSYGVSEEELKKEEITEKFTIEDESGTSVYYFKLIWKDGGYLYRLDEENGDIILLIDEYTAKYMIKDEWIFYITAYDRHLYRVDKNGNNKERLLYGKYYDSFGAVIDEEYLYSIDYWEEGLFRLNLNTKEKEILVKGASKIYYSSNGYIGYADSEGYLNIYNDGKIIKRMDIKIEKIEYTDPWLYYILKLEDYEDLVYLFKLKYDGSDNVILLNIPIKKYVFNEEGIIFYINSENNKVYQYDIHTGLNNLIIDKEVDDIRWNPVTKELYHTEAKGTATN